MRAHNAKRTPQLEEEILDRLATGETLTSICKALDLSNMSWRRWIDADPDLARAYHHARVVGADVIADDILQIVDDVPTDSEAIAKARLRSDMRLRLLAKWQPKAYGDKQLLEHQGPDGGPVQVAYADVSALARQMRAVAAGRADPEALLEYAPKDDAQDVL